MFPNLKQTFNTPGTSFGFSSNVTQNPFGQSTFGKTPSTGFGTPAPAFGAQTTPLFGQTSQHGSLFASSAPTPSFGQSVVAQPTFGSGMFGNTTSQPSGSGLFGSANTSTFGQQNKTTGFGFGAQTANTGFFSQSTSQVQPQQQATGLFGQTTSNLFGQSSGFGANTANNQMGTVIKFTPVTGTDTMVKGSINQTISTRHHCITCMKEYENKSLEELRWEDYQMNRKGPQQGTQPSGGLFGNISQPVGAPLFGNTATATSANTLFGQQENKSVFGQTPTGTGFGQPNTGFGATPSTNASAGLFGKSMTGFGTNATTSSAFPFSSTAQTNNLFGSNTAAKQPFGVSSQPNTLFGQPTGFGTQSTFGSFGNNTNQNVGLFSQNKTTPFNIMPTSTNNTFGSFGQPAAQNTSSLFSGAKTNTGFGGFGSTTTAPVFGQPSFGQTNPGLFNTSFNKSAAPLFGQTQTTNTLGTGLPLGTGNSLFGGNVNKPNTMFGSSLSMFNSGFGSNTNTTAFNLGGTPTQPGVPNQDQTQVNGEQQIISMSSTPYGIPNLLNNISEVSNDLKDCTRPTNPGELNALLNTVTKAQTTTPTEKLKPVQVFGRKIPMFDGLEHRDETLISNIRINNNPKRLIVRNSPSNNKDYVEHSFIRASNPLILDNDIINVSNRSLFEEEAKENIYPNLQKFLKDMSPTVMKNIENKMISNDLSIVNNSENTPISTPSKALLLSSDSNKENDSDSKEDDSEQFTEANESHDSQEENEPPRGLVSHPSTESNSSSTITLAPVQHPTGIILTRPEYYTVPPLDELVKYISEDGSCVVKGFTVGRYGYGNVYFPEAFDISNLNLEELVHFRHKEINIYPDDTKKPPQGQGLNRKAQVTLDKVWPLNKKAKALITDVETLTKMDYAGRLRRLCEKQNTRFVEYRPDTGSWVFKVDHFSKYGHRDSEEEDEEVEILKDPTKEAPSKMDQKIVTSRLEPLEPIVTITTALPNFVSTNNMGLKDIMDMPRRLISEDDELFLGLDTYETYGTPHITIDDSGAKCTLMKSTFFEKEILDYDDNASDVCSSDGGIIELSNYVSKSSPKRMDIEIEEDFDIPEEEFLQLDIFDEIEMANKLAQPDIEQITIPDVAAAPLLVSNGMSDIIALKGRSFRVGWSKNMTLLCLNKQNLIVDEDDSAIDALLNSTYPNDRCVDVLKLVNLNDRTFHNLEEHLECQYKWSGREMRDGIPYYESFLGTNKLLEHQEIGKKLPKENYIRQVWDLCVTLFDDNKENVKCNEKPRKQLFSNWVKSVVENTVDNEINDPNRDDLSKILSCISGNKIDEAAEIAIKSNNLNLSLLVAQLPGGMPMKNFLQKQLQNWDECNVYKQFDTTLLKIYMTFAGKPFTNVNEKTVVVYENMDWIRVLAFYFWYICNRSHSLSYAISTYEQMFEKYSHTVKPIPNYEDSPENIYDLRFQLMKFYSDKGYPLTKLFNTFAHTNDPLDCRLSWFLFQTLHSLGYTDISKQGRNYLHIQFAAQLEQMGLWHWAIFVLMFVENSSLRKNYILNMLGRHIKLHDETSEDYDRREYMLVHKFKVPSQWIDYEKATLAMYRKRYKDVVYYLCYAKDWQRAYAVIMTHIVPDHFLSYDYEYLIKLLTPLSEHSNVLPNWEDAGGLVLDFAKLGIQYNEIISLNDPVNIKNQLINFRSAVINVSVRFKNFEPETYLHDVCLAEMSGRIAVMLRKLLNIINGHNYDLCVDTATNAQTLPMTRDYLKQELNSILIDFVNENQPKMIYL